MISYLSCNDGKLELHNYEDDGSNEIVCSSNHVNELANCLANYGFGEYFRTSSSMDFADEYGFATHDGAKEIFYTAQNMIQDEIVANGQFDCDFDG